MTVIANGYCELIDLKAALGITDSTDDIQLADIINAVSRWIDRTTRRRFHTTSADETRYYTPFSYSRCVTDDIVSVTSAAIDLDGSRTYSNVLAATDYDLVPENAALDGWSYTGVCIAPQGQYTFNPSLSKSFRVVGKFGFDSSSPIVHTVQAACMVQCIRLFKRKDAPFGVAGAGPMGQVLSISDIDPDVRALLAPPVTRTRFR